ncbi:MAG: dihydrolipoamide acetyltransferase family protein [Longimicrobiales bacterium]|nr:dihydrolipoamide acetyltransferase family protein [Longimicrobiales bacterium]
MARIEVPMPQMGESIAEGTVSRWLKSPGDTVERDEPILEISTDKVDAEIPAPASGTLVAVEVQEGETVEVGTIVAYIDPEGGAPDQPAPAASGDGGEAEQGAAGAPEGGEAGGARADASGTGATARAEGSGGAADEASAAGGEMSAEERLRTRSTPVVRRIAEEHGVDIAHVPGTGHAGRVTKQDILDFIESGGTAGEAAAPQEGGPKAERAPAPSAPAARAAAPAPSVAPSELWKAFYGEVQHPEFPVRAADRVEPMDKIRRLTAEHMVVAKRIAPHVHSFIEIDFTAVDAVRRALKPRWEEQGVRVSYTAFVTWAVSRLLREFPMVNGTVSGNNLIYRGNINVGMAVDLNPGLIVPVIHDTDDLSLTGIARKIVDLAERARSRQLQPSEIQGATFSITNPGVLGTTVGMPVIPKGTAAILGTGSIDKRVVVVTDPETGGDSIAIRKRSFFSMGYDHRLVDGADAARFLSALKELLEDFPEDA